ncbi:YlbF family regulator [Paenibacillus thiaminolyticus]|uniref:YlbF family regulator n=1 Tax=Paenibacillus thiaminolyticus TaxID=49283 RepID=UPI0023501A78|nr:YlbF family regulator [Paenibacillus thiaminolyticus]WCR27222.1 YlbF family regulator [Paenibacillus thiaminolyticus]
MSVYDQAHELARALQQSDEAKAVETAMKAIEADADSKRMLDDFRLRQMEMQQKMMTGEMPEQSELDKMEKLYEVISMNSEIAELFEAERRLAVVIQDVNKIVSDALGHLYA